MPAKTVVATNGGDLMTMPTTNTQTTQTTTIADSEVPGVLTVARAASILGITPEALRQRLSRGRRKGKYRTIHIGNLCVIPAETLMQLFAEQQER